MARIEGTNLVYGRPELHDAGNRVQEAVRQAVEDRERQKRIAAEDLAMSMSTRNYMNTIADEDLAMSRPTTIAESAKRAYDTQAAQSLRDQIARQSAMSFLNPTYVDAVNLDRAASQLESRMDQTGYPSLDALGNFFNRYQANVLASGGTPVFVNGRYEGVTKDGRYSGNPLFDPYANAFSGHVSADIEREQKVVLPVYDETANAKRCPDGYIFDEQLQACRLDTQLPETSTSPTYDFYQQPYSSTSLLDDDGYEYGVPLIYG